MTIKIKEKPILISLLIFDFLALGFVVLFPLQAYGLIKHYLIWILAVHLILILILGLSIFKFLFGLLSKIDKKTWIIILVIFLIGTAFRFSQFYLYGFFPLQEYANYLQKDGVMTNRCFFGSYEQCLQFEVAYVPPGHPFLAVIVNWFLGFSSLSPAYLSAFFSSLTIFLIFLICHFLFKKDTIGLFASSIFALSPVSIYFSQVSEPRSVSIFFICFAILIYLLALKEKKLRLWILFVLLFSYSIYVRQENYVLLLLFLTGLFLFNYKFDFSQIKNYILIGTLFLVLQVPVWLWLTQESLFAATEPVFGKSTFSLSYIPIQLYWNVKMLFNWLPGGARWWPDSFFPVRFHPIISAIALGGLLLIFIKKDRREKIFVVSWFLIYLLFHASYIDCDINSPRCDGPLRYTSMLIPSYSIIVGYVFYQIWNILKFNYLKYAFLVGFFTIIFSASRLTIPTTLFVDARLAGSGQKDLISAVEKTATDCIIVTVDALLVRSEILKNNHRKTIYILNILDNNIFTNEASRSDCVFYFRDGSSNKDQIDEEWSIINKRFDAAFSFREGSIEAYSLKMK